MKGYVTMSRICSNNPDIHNEICFKIEDLNYNRLITVNIKPKEFALLVTGQALIECEIEE